jgi:hypothetical protein
MEGRPDVVVFNKFNLEELEKLITATKKELEQLQKQPEEKAMQPLSEHRSLIDLRRRVKAVKDVLLKQSPSKPEYKVELKGLKKLIKPQKQLEKLLAEHEQATNYLKNLQRWPENQFVDVVSILYGRIKQFEETHFSSLYWRLQVLQLKRMIDKELPTARAVPKEEKQSDEMNGLDECKVNQLRYGLLCGFLWVKWRELQNISIQDSRSMREDKEQLSAAIYEALQACHIAEDGDLPDEMKIKSSCVDFYGVLFANEKPLDYSDLAQDDRERWQKEFTEYSDWSWSLRENCAAEENYVLADFCDQVIAVVSRMSTYFKGDTPNVDANVYIEILRQTRKLMQGTGDVVRYQCLAQAVLDTNPTSLGRKLAGAMLCLLGVIFIAAAVVSILATSGASLFCSALFLKAGSAALAVVATTMVGSVILAPLTLWQGVSFFRPRGLGKEMTKLTDMLEKRKDIPDQLQGIKNKYSQQQPASVLPKDPIVHVAEILMNAGI